MSEVSCQAFSYFFALEAAGLCDVERLLEGISVPRAAFDDIRGRVSWEVWARLCERYAWMVGSEAQLIANSRYGVNETFRRYVRRAMALFVSEAQLYPLMMRWVLPGMYRSHTFSLEVIRPGELRATARLLAGLRGSRPWFLMFVGGLQSWPLLLGREVARVEIEQLGERSASVLVRFRVEERSVWQRLRGLTELPALLAGELTAQQAEMAVTFSAMRRATASFQNVLNAAPLAVVVLREGQIIYANPLLRGMVGSGVVGRTAAELFHPLDRPALNGLWQQPGRVSHLRLRAAGGEERLVEVRAVRGVEFDGPGADLLVGVDLSHTQQARLELERSEATLRLLLDTQTDLILRLDDEMRIVDVRPGGDIEESEQLLQSIGRTVPELAQALSPDALTPEVARAVAEYPRIIRAGQRFEQSLTIQGPGGNSRFLVFRGSPVLGGRESILWVRDETKRREVEQRLAVSERMASVGTLAAGVAHEINNPLAYLTLNAEMLRDDLATLPEEARARLQESVDAITEGTYRIRDTVARMRELSRVERRLDRVDPRRAVEGALAMSAHETRHRARVLSFLDQTSPVLADMTELVQVLINLLVNAAHAMDGTPSPPGGHELSVSLSEEEGVVLIKIQDTGAGMPPRVLRRLFDPFYTTKPRGVGTGLGLSIAKRVILDLGGNIDVQSEVGRGSLFCVRLPSAAAPVTEAPVVLPAPAPRPAVGHVFVIDDELLITQTVRQALAGYQVDTFSAGGEALEALQNGAVPDVILCDLMMPGMSGVEVYERLSFMFPALLSRVLFFSGGAFSEQARDVLRQGAKIVEKPISRDALRRVVAEVIEAHTTR